MLCGRGGIGRRARLRIWWIPVQVQVLSPAPCKSTPTLRRGAFLHRRGGVTWSRSRVENSSGGRVFPANDRSAQFARDSSPVSRTKNNLNWTVWDNLGYFLSKPQVWYIIVAQSAAYIISPLGCISSRRSRAYLFLRFNYIPLFEWMICKTSFWWYKRLSPW